MFAVFNWFRIRIEIGRIYRKNTFLKNFCAELHGPCKPSVKKEVCPRPPDTGRAGLHGGPCGTPDFTMGFGFGELHGPCQPLLFEVFGKLF